MVMMMVILSKILMMTVMGSDRDDDGDYCSDSNDGGAGGAGESGSEGGSGGNGSGGSGGNDGGGDD